MTPQYYTVEQAAEILVVHVQQVRELLATGALEFIDVAPRMATHKRRINKKTGEAYKPRVRPRIPDYALEKFAKARSSKTRRTTAAA